MKTPLLQLSLLSIWMVVTGGVSVAATKPGPSAQLDAIVDEYLELNRQGGVLWPGGGSGADGAPDLSPESFEARVQRRRELLARVRSLETGPLTGAERTDRRLLVALPAGLMAARRVRRMYWCNILTRASVRSAARVRG